MVNLLGFGSVRNFAKAISTGANINNNALCDHEENSCSEQRRGGGGGGSNGPCLQNAPCAAVSDNNNNNKNFATAEVMRGHHALEDHAEDPLIYRLQHQQRYLEEKQDRRSGKFRKSSSSRRSSQRDPFDVGGSFTSEEASLIERNSNGINKGKNSSSVDVVGWGSGGDSDFDLSGRSNSFRRREGSYIFSDLGDDHEEDEKSELYVDFGGVTPIKTEDGNSQSIHCSSDDVDVDVRLPISPSPQFSVQKVTASSQHMHRLQHHRHEMERRHSSSSSSNNSYTPGNNEGSHDRYSPPLHRPSHQDLSHILSSLEKEAEEAPSPEAAPAPKSRRFGGASSCCDSTLSSPTSKRRRSISISSCSASPKNDQKCISSSSDAVSLHAPLPFPQETPQRSSPKEKQSPPMPQSSATKQLSSPPSQTQPQTQTQTQPHRKSPQEEEEDDPRLAQLRQQTTEELRTELFKMQALSKSNLEDSWAETERLRVEISQLEEDLKDAKKQLVELRSSSNAAVSSSANQGVDGWQQGTPSVHSENSDGHWNSRISPSPQRKGLRGSFSVMSLADLVQETKANSPFPTNTWEVKTTTTKFNWKPSGGKSLRNNRNYSIGAVNALVGNATTDNINETANIGSSKSCSGKTNTRSILADLGKGFRSGAKTSADESSAAGSDFDFGTGIDIDESKRSGRITSFNIFHGTRGIPEFDKSDQSSSSENGKDADDDPSSGENDACISDDDSIDIMGGVFYPPPSENEAKEEDITQNSHSSLSSVVESSVACSEMDDFDFDPLSEMPTPAVNATNISKSVSVRTKDPRNAFARRPSLSSLFEGKYRSDDDEEEDSSSSSDSSSNNNPPRRKEDRAKVLKSSILETDNEINQLTEKIRVQADDILNCEADILIANTKCGEDENQFKSKESILQKEVEGLEQKDSDTASKLEYSDGSKRNEQERENNLKEKLAYLSEDECEDDLENQLSLYQEQYNTSQENAISSLSGLLNDFEAMCIPSLRGELEDNVCGDIIARFDDLTDKEEELVRVLSDTDRLTSCHASFQQIQKHIETAMNWQNQLGQLETDLHSYLVTITMLIKQDDEGTHTTESSTASERLSLERVFVEAIILHLGSVKQNQGKLILDALFKSVEFLTKWDEWLLPDFATSPPPARLSSDEFATGVSTIVMLECVVGKASAELAAVKADVLNEQAKFQAKMQSAGLSYPRPNSNAMFDTCHVNNTPGGFGTSHDDSDERLTKESAVKKLNKQITQQISTAESIISERESLVDKFASSFHPMLRQARDSQVHLQLQDEFFEEDTEGHELEEVVKEISMATKSLSEKEFLRKKYSTELDSMQAQASRDSKANLQTLDEIQSKIKHILAKLANEESLIASLKSLLRSTKEDVSSRSITRTANANEV